MGHKSTINKKQKEAAVRAAKFHVRAEK